MASLGKALHADGIEPSVGMVVPLGRYVSGRLQLALSANACSQVRDHYIERTNVD